MSSNIIYIGVKGHVVAVDKSTGATLWQTKLKSGMASGAAFVTLLVQEGRVFAHTYGEVFCLDRDTGAILWKNELSGLGYDIATLASDGAGSGSMPLSAAMKKNAEDSASAVVFIAGAGS